MAKSETTRGKGAKDGAAARAASGASADVDGAAGGATTRKPATKKAASRTPVAKRAAATGGAAGETSASGGGGTTKRATVKRRASGAGGPPDTLREHLRQFARSRPDGWGHDDWIGLLDELRGHGHDVSDPEAVGMQLEREHLMHRLEDVDGLGRKSGALADRFGTLYSLRHASVDDIAGVKGMDRQLAERIKERLH